MDGASEAPAAPPGNDARDDRDRVEASGHTARVLFVGASAFAFIVFVLVRVLLGARGNDATMQAKKMMPAIHAELVDAPLTAQQMEWPLETGDGKTVTLAQMPRDRLIFLNFWATWCGPCRDELPSLFRLRQQLVDRRFMMIAVSYDEKWDDIRDFFEKWVGRLPADSQMFLVKDPHLDEGQTLRESFGTTQIPDSYVILDGRVLARFVNSRNWTDPSILEYFDKLAPVEAAQ